MFFFIGGIQPRTVLLTREKRVCVVCGHPEICKKRVDNYLSLFFIPLFPVKKGTPFWACGNCNTVYDDSGTPKAVRRNEERRMCPRCGREIFSDYAFCPYCGITLQKKKSQS